MDVTIIEGDPISKYAFTLSKMSATELCKEYIETMADRKNPIEKIQIKHEMAKRFFTTWANKKLNE